MYKTYIDVVHIQKDEASSLFSMFAADSQSQEAEETLSQGERNIADAPATQASAGSAGGVAGAAGLLP